MGIILDNLLLCGPGTVFSNSYWRGVEKRHRKIFESDQVAAYDEKTEDENDNDGDEEEVEETKGQVVGNTIMLNAFNLIASSAHDLNAELEKVLKEEQEQKTKQFPTTSEKIVDMEISAINEEESVLDEMEEKAIREAMEEKSSR
ncbi:MAG: hypothetical protein K2O59_00830 [Lachnospiraceae bacterium]|nr:hypothetical protein [Lachnospiraceae bacterium]